MTLATAPGNNVIVDLGNRRFALYAHFETASIQVKVGDRVHKGEILGKLGNSGNTTNPHLHLQIADRPSFGAGEALPFVIDDFKSSGTVTDIRPLFDGKPAILDSTAAGPHLRRLPLNNSVVNFN
jgi:murein DD-endopeptidase MepM/ murein hydrolase activator NlpD